MTFYAENSEFQEMTTCFEATEWRMNISTQLNSIHQITVPSPNHLIHLSSPSALIFVKLMSQQEAATDWYTYL